MIKVAIIGFGGIARAHLSGYRILEQEGKAKVIAAMDIRPEAFTEAIDINLGADESGKLGFNTYTDLEEMLSKESPDMIDICLPTYLHAETAIAMMKRGFPVMVEKPMARTYEQCQEMLAVSLETGKPLMVGQVLHFFAEYEYLKDVTAAGTFGKVRSAIFQRLSGPPTWGYNNWFMDAELSGGCLLDMHIHDVDMTRYLFGEPKRVCCSTHDAYSRWSMANSTMYYDDFTVTAIGDWSLAGHPFGASYRVAFENATVEAAGGKVTVYPREGKPYEPSLNVGDNFAKEIGYFVDLLVSGEENTKNPPASAALSVKLAEALRDSADNGSVLCAYEG